MVLGEGWSATFRDLVLPPGDFWGPSGRIQEGFTAKKNTQTRRCPLAGAADLSPEYLFNLMFF